MMEKSSEKSEIKEEHLLDGLNTMMHSVRELLKTNAWCSNDRYFSNVHTLKSIIADRMDAVPPPIKSIKSCSLAGMLQ